ncbi:hypothetical protein HK104_001229 [Borealophlyctis nickersoniae]|nr:hypothetical protein HK104_001229 [Borealophlyctis nickersoniae]
MEDEDFDIYADDGLGAAGLGGDDGFLYGDLPMEPATETAAPAPKSEAKPEVERDRRVSQLSTSSYTDAVDYGDDDGPPGLSGPPSAGVVTSAPPDRPVQAKAEPKVEADDLYGQQTPVQASPVPMETTSGQATPVRQMASVTGAQLNAAAYAALTPGKEGPWGTPPTPTNLPRALFIEELPWWTTDEDIKLAITDAGVVDQFVESEFAFSEHRVNGKSKGICYLQFTTPEACQKTKEFFEQMYVFFSVVIYLYSEIHSRKPVVKLVTGATSNPFRTVPKDPKEARLEAAKAARGGPITSAGPSPIAQANSPSTVPNPPVAAGRGTPSARGGAAVAGAGTGARGGYTGAAGFGRGAPYMGAAPGFFEPPEFFPPPMGMPMGGPPPFGDRSFRGGMGRGFPGGHPPRDAYGLGGFYERGPYPGPGGPYFDGPEYEYDAYGPGPGYGRGGPAGRGYPPRPFPHGYDGAGRGRGSGRPDVALPDADRDDDVKKEGPDAWSDSGRGEKRKWAEGENGDREGPDGKRISYDPYRKPDDRGYDRDRYRRDYDRDGRYPGVEVMVKERGREEYDRRSSSGRDRDRDSRDSRDRRDRDRDRDRDYRDRDRDRYGRDRRSPSSSSETYRRQSIASAVERSSAMTPDRRPTTPPPLPDERNRSRSRSRTPARSKSRSRTGTPVSRRTPSPDRRSVSRSPAGGGEGSGFPSSAGASGAGDAMTPPVKDRSRSRTRSRSRSRSTSRHRHRRRKSSRSERDEGGENGDVKSSSSRRKKSSRHSSSKKHKSSHRSSRHRDKDREKEKGDREVKKEGGAE